MNKIIEYLEQNMEETKELIAEVNAFGGNFKTITVDTIPEIVAYMIDNRDFRTNNTNIASMLTEYDDWRLENIDDQVFNAIALVADWLNIDNLDELDHTSLIINVRDNIIEELKQEIELK